MRPATKCAFGLPHSFGIIAIWKQKQKQLKCEVKENAPSLPITFWKNIFEDSKRIKGKKVVVSSFCLYSRVYNVKFIEGDFKVPVLKTGSL